MKSVKCVYWKEDGVWIGYLQDYPDYWTQGETLADLKEHLRDLHRDIRRRCAGHEGGSEQEPPWMAGFGALSDLAGENRRVLAAIEEEFERLEPEDTT